LQKGALRQIVRVADLTLHLGHTEEAINLFAAADQFRRRLRNRPLDGEPARRFALALIRTREIGNRLEQAESLIEQNIAHHLDIAGSARNPARRVSNDIIPFQILRAGIARIKGKFSGAAVALAAVRSHELVVQNLCNFVTHTELTLEEMRLAVAQQDFSAGIEMGSREIYYRLSGMHHIQLANEALLIGAEGLSGVRREEVVNQCLMAFSGTLNHLRVEDALELRRGGSAVKRFGL